jgi:hypothetical protein
MAFQRPKKQPNFATLKSTLAQTKKTEHPLYQTIQILIERLMQFQGITVEEIADINNSINNVNSVVNNLADKTRTYITKDDETLNLPNSIQLLAGTNVAFDDTVANKRTINVTIPPVSVSDHVPMTLGGEPLEFMSDGDGSSILIEYTPGT